MSTILVTGAGGYIGSHVAKKLLQDGHKVVAFDNFSKGYREPLEIISKYGSLEICEGDISVKDDIEKAFQDKKIDAVMHLAAFCSVDESVKNPELYFKNNTQATSNLIQVMLGHKVKKIIFSSTCAVYGNSKYLPIDENHDTLPLNPYGDSKLKAEEEIINSGLEYVVFRYFNVCGADSDGEIGDSKKPSELLVQNAVRGALGIEDFKLTYSPVNTRDGSPIRDYVDVEDIAEAHIKALKYLEEGKNSEIFNLGNGKGWSVKEIVDTVKKELQADFMLKEGTVRQGEYAEVYASTEKAQTMLNWKPEKSLSESVKSLSKWYNNKPNGYAK